eukprot:6070035-Amphidinium_carterae.1
MAEGMFLFKTYWNKRWFLRLQRQMKFRSAQFDGCLFGSAPGTGVARSEHLRHRKPWRIDSNNDALIVTLNGKICNKERCCHSHVQIEGVVTKASGSYPVLLAQTIHTAVRRTAYERRAESWCLSCMGIEENVNTYDLHDDIAEKLIEDVAGVSCFAQE